MLASLLDLYGKKFIFCMMALTLTFIITLMGKLTAEWATSISVITLCLTGADAYITGKTADATATAERKANGSS